MEKPGLWGPSWTHLGEDDLGLIPYGHLVELDRDPEDHTDGGAPLAQVVELCQKRGGEGCSLVARLALS